AWPHVGSRSPTSKQLRLHFHHNVVPQRGMGVFWDELKRYFKEGIALNGHPEERLPNTLSVSFIGKVGQDILESIPELAASTGSACHSRMVQISSVLRAMKVEERVGKGTIRFSLGRYTTKEEIDEVVRLLKERI
ncbi:aminotransferase class V-fold PLP-dependent enzyme, partial [Alicyclobacillus macrosporangiidus]|uniref:aminotransferase class V-fold PLP-dependent enzyme n=1 Tax=Alicyclobacillus macrosporangiidus TaxID=392015 RepID=UPI0011144801